MSVVCACFSPPSMSATMDDEALVAFAAVCAAALTILANTLDSRHPFSTSALGGHLWVSELLHGNHRRMRNTLGISPCVFQKLVAALELHAAIADSKYISTEVQVAMFLYTCHMATSTHDVGEQFQHGTATVSKYNQTWP